MNPGGVRAGLSRGELLWFAGLVCGGLVCGGLVCGGLIRAGLIRRYCPMILARRTRGSHSRFAFIARRMLTTSFTISTIPR